MGNKEVRDILLRRIVRQNEQFWTVAPSDVKFHFHGVRDGAGDVRLFGVTHLTRSYQVTDMEPTVVLSAAESALNSLGYPMRLASMPDAKGCLYTPNWIAPVLLTVEQGGDGLQMSAYTGRSLLFAKIRCRIALWILEKRLPEGITCAGKNKKLEKKEAKQKEAKQKEPRKKETKPNELKPKEEKQEPAKRAGKRIAIQEKKKTAPKRLKK
jgi:hypothetical protein